MLAIVPELVYNSANPLFPAVAGNWVGIRNVFCPLPGTLERLVVLMAPSEVRMFTVMVSAPAFGFTMATAVCKPEVLSKGTRMRLEAVNAGAVASCAGFPGACEVKMA